MTTWVVSFSGGVSSWAAARLVKDYWLEPGDEFHLLFADTLIEDEETYAFLDAAAANLETPLTRIADGRTPWQVFVDERFMGNQKVDPCSRVLKRSLIARVSEERYGDHVRVVGIDWTEIHRLDRLRDRQPDQRWEAPLADPDDRIPSRFQWMDKRAVRQWARDEGLPDQRLYEMGMPHANCGGGCIKAGTAHFKKLLNVFPERYAEWEEREAETIAQLRAYGSTAELGLIRSRAGGGNSFKTLAEFRREQEAGGQLSILDEHDWGGCGCAID